jgi:hypothetical protein
MIVGPASDAPKAAGLSDQRGLAGVGGQADKQVLPGEVTDRTSTGLRVQR